MFGKYLKIFRGFSSRERAIFFVAAGVLIISVLFLLFDLFSRKTEEVPVSGGNFSEGIAGQPSFVNPVIAESGSPEEDIAAIIFDSAIDMAESVKISADSRTWTLRLKEGLIWHDGAPITSDDVIFTVQSIQDPDSRSSLYSSFQGVMTERESEIEMRFILPTPYSFFNASLSRLRPLPKHIFGNIPAANFRLSEYNLKPVGSGPYKFVSLDKRKNGFIENIRLARNNRYYGNRPYLNNLVFKFYEDRKTVLKAFNRGLIDAVAGLSPKEAEEIRIGHQEKSFRLPRYYAVFLNSGSRSSLRELPVRKAMAMLTDKRKLVDQIFNGRAVSVSGPIIVGMEGYDPNYESAAYDPEGAKAILESSGWKIGEDGIRTKSGERLEFSIIVPDNDFLKETISLISENFAVAGIRVNPTVVSEEGANNYLRTRNYEMLVFGNAYFGGAADLFSYWQSSERFYPGLNLSLYMDSETDSLIDAIRKESDNERRKVLLERVNIRVAENYPAIFLYSPNYLYAISSKLKGTDGQTLPAGRQGLASPADRFKNIEDWYVKTARISK